MWGMQKGERYSEGGDRHGESALQVTACTRGTSLTRFYVSGCSGACADGNRQVIHECLKVSTAIRSGLVDKNISPDTWDVAMRALVTLQQRMNAIAGIPNMPQKALGLNMDTTNGHEVEAKLAREDIVQRMFKAKDAGDEATAKRYEQAIVETDRKNKEASDRAAEIMAKRVDYVPPSAEE